MALLEARFFGSVKHLLVVAESEEESKLIDRVLGAVIPTGVHGEVTLSDGYGQHYIRLEKGLVGEPSNKSKQRPDPNRPGPEAPTHTRTRFEVHHEPECFKSMEAENCSDCRQPTRMWLTPHIPLCEVCCDQRNRLIENIVAKHRARKRK